MSTHSAIFLLKYSMKNEETWTNMWNWYPPKYTQAIW